MISKGAKLWYTGITLTDLTIEKIVASKIIPKENFYLTVHEPELIAIGEKHGINVFKRSAKSAVWDGGENAHIRDMYEWWNKIPFKYVVLINACVPFLTTETIDGFFQHYLSKWAAIVCAMPPPPPVIRTFIFIPNLVGPPHI